MALLSSLGKYKDTGLLLVRVGLGLAFLLLHGYPKLVGGPDVWKAVGGAMVHIGVDVYPTFWGFLAGLIETLGGLFLLLGLFFRPTCIFLSFTMAMAAFNHLAAGDGLSGSLRPLELLVVFMALILIGPGKYSVDKR